MAGSKLRAADFVRAVSELWTILPTYRPERPK
jgi:hypothetical protein